MQWRWLSQEIPYTGRELHSGWIADTAAIEGDAIVAFVGPCEVPLEHMVDMEDVRRGVPIQAARMLPMLRSQTAGEDVIKMLPIIPMVPLQSQLPVRASPRATALL